MITEIANIGNRLIGDAAGLVKYTFDNLADDHKISDKESKSICENIKSKLFDKSADMESTIKELLYKFYEKMDYATPEEVDKLRRRIAILEKLTQK